MNPNKPKLALVPLWAVRAVSQAFEEGLVGPRKPNGWRDLEWTEDLKLEYDSALLRHLEEAEATTDPVHYKESLAHAIANLIILMYHEPSRIAAVHGWPDDTIICGDSVPKRPGNHAAELIGNELIDPIGRQNAVAPGSIPMPSEPTSVASGVIPPPNPDHDATWHRLSGWIRLTDEDALAHWYDGPNAPLCDVASGIGIPKGAARILYNGPPDNACEECATLIIERLGD